MFDLNFQAHLILLIDRGRSQLKPDNSSLADAAEFRPTRWSVVLLSAQSKAPGSQAALAALCRLYWYPLYAFVRRRGYSPEDAQDLTQGFFLHLLDHKALAQVDPLKGKFRSVLLVSIQNYLSKEADRARCLKRGGEMQFVPLDAKNAEDRYQLEVSVGTVKMLIHRLRKRYTTLSRAEVARTVSDPGEIDEEIHALCDALIASEGRLGP